MQPLFKFILLLLLLLSASGCTSYAYTIRPVQNEVLNGQIDDAIHFIDKQLGVDSYKELPNEIDGEKALLLLERATLLQGVREYKWAARDMGIVDQHMEFLDIAAYDRNEVAKWLFSDNSYKYRAPAYERLMLNSENLINYLALHDLEGARVEAKRFEEGAAYFIQQTKDEINNDIVALGFYLSGFTYEKSFRFDEALRAYSYAYIYGFHSPELADRLVDLTRVSNRKSAIIANYELENLAQKGNSLGELSRAAYIEKYNSEYDILIISQTGMSPYLRPVSERLIDLRGILLGSAAYFLSQNDLQTAGALAVGSLLGEQRIHVPELESRDVPYNPYFSLTINGESVVPMYAVDLSQQLKNHWESIKGVVNAAAFSRAISRIATGTAVGASGGDLGVIAGAILTKTLQNSDVPDTRGWNMLPSTIFLTRSHVKTGHYTLRFTINDGSEEVAVNAQPRAYSVYNFSKFRQ